MIGNAIQAMLTPLLCRKKTRLKHMQLAQKLAKNCDRDSEVKICLQPGLEAQKVEKH